MSRSSAALPNPESERLLVRAVERSERKAIQLPVGFMRSASGDPPLAILLRGGQGGEVRLKLYLSMTLLAARHPFEIRQMPSRAWAEMLALAAPQTLGGRRVADALQFLRDQKFIAVTPAAGAPATVKLLSPLLTGQRYSRPRPQSRYVSLPAAFWREQWITHLSGAGVALLLVLLELQGGIKQQADAPSVPRERRVEYGLSDDTWTRARKELEAAGLLEVRRVPQGREFDWRRMRNTYWVRLDKLGTPPPQSPLR
jgi:hypothetical protein